MVAGMEDITAKLEKLLTETEGCDLIGRLASGPNKRELYKTFAVHIRSMARDIESVIAVRSRTTRE